MDRSYHNDLVKKWANDRLVFWQVVRESVLGAPEELKKKSYVHDNGFAKITLWSSGDGSTETRLHFWNKAFDETNIHSHCFDLYSTVLFGALLDRVYAEDEGGIEYPKFLYTKRGAGQSYGMKSTGVGAIVLKEAKARRSGESYDHPFSHLHSSEAVTDHALTLFTTCFDGCPETADVFSKKYAPGTAALQSPSMMDNDISETIKLAIEATS